MKHTDINWKNHLADAFVFLWCITLTLYLSQQRGFPYLYGDEYGVLGAAAVFAGLDWSAPTMPFYGFLLSIFTFPLYWLDLEPSTLYRSVLVANALLVALAATFALRTIRQLPGSRSETLQIGAVIAGFSYTSVLHYSSMAIGETALLFCFFLIAYHLTTLLNTNQTRIFNAVLLGVGIGLAQYAHSRGVAFVIAGSAVLFYALGAKLISRKQFIITATSTVLTILLFTSLKSHLLTTFYKHEYTDASIISFIGSKSALLSIEGLINLVQLSFGQIVYLLTSSFGLLIPGLAILAFTTHKYIQDRNIQLTKNSNLPITSTRGILSSFILLSFIVMFAASIMQMLGAQRADHYFYGRYNEVMLPAIIITSILFLESLPKKTALKWISASFLITLFFALALRFYPEEILNQSTVWFNITGWFVHSTWEINTKYILGGTLTAFVVLTISVLISRKLFILTLCAFFISAALHNFEVQHKGADKSWGTFNKLAKIKNIDMPGIQLYVTGTDWTKDLKGEALQFAFKNANVRFDNKDLNNIDAVLDYKGNVCNHENTVAYIDKASFCYISERLRKNINFTSLPLHIESAEDRPKFAATIETSDTVKTNGIVLNTIDHICTLVSKGYYTSWFHHCLPSIDIKISQQELSGNENHKLGIFVTDSKGNWLHEWREKLDNKKLAHSGTIQITTSVQTPSRINKGEYQLNIATIDDHGWDFRSVEKIQLFVK